MGWGPGEDGEVPEVEPLVVASCPSPPALSPVPHSFWGSTGPGGWGGVGQRGALGPLLLPCAPRTPTCGGCRHPGLSCFGSIRSAWPEGSEAPTWFSVPSLPAGSPEGEGHAGPSTPAPTPCSPPPHPRCPHEPPAGLGRGCTPGATWRPSSTEGEEGVPGPQGPPLLPTAMLHQPSPVPLAPPPPLELAERVPRPPDCTCGSLGAPPSAMWNGGDSGLRDSALPQILRQVSRGHFWRQAVGLL